MANKPFDRTIINPREKPLSQDINQAQSTLDYALRRLARSLLGSPTFTAGGTYGSYGSAFTPNDGFLPGSFIVVPSAVPDMNVTVKAGIGLITDGSDVPSAIGGIIGLDDLSSYKPLVLMTDVSLPVPAAPGVGNSRIDIVEVRTNRLAGDLTSRLVLDPTTGNFSPTNVNKTLSFALDGSTGSVISPASSTAAISYKKGVAAATGAETEPATTAGYTKIARVNVGPTATAIDYDSLVDHRRIIFPGNMVPFAWSGNMHYAGGVMSVQQGGANPGWNQAPPDIRLGMVPSAGIRGNGILVVCGGSIKAAAANVTGAAPGAAGAFTITHMYPPAGGYPVVMTATSAEQTLFGLATPSIKIGVGTRIALFNFQSHYQAAGVTNITDATLEDIYVTLNGHLSY